MNEYDEMTIALPDGYQAYARYWKPARVRGAVLYLHGIQSHCGWFEASAGGVAEAGYAVLQPDRRGCGQNPQGRGHAESAEQLIADAHACRDVLLHRAGVGEFHLVGVSWGGKLAAAAYVADPAGVKSMSLVTPGLFPKVGVSREEMTRIGFAMLYEPGRFFDIPLNKGCLFTGNADWDRFIETDELTLRRCTASFYLASRRMDRIVARLRETPPVPLHLLLVGDERIIENDKTQIFLQELRWGQAVTTMYPAARHGLEFEADAVQYVRDLITFLDEH